MPKKDPKHDAHKLENFTSGIITDAATKRLTKQAERVIGDAEYLRSVVSKWQNCSIDTIQGRTFEQLEVIKFNLDSISKGAQFHAVTTDALGDPHAAADILICDGKKVLREIQAKSYGSAAKSVYAQSDPKYAGMDRLIPKEQFEKGCELLDTRSKTTTLKAEDYKETRPHLTGELRHKDVASSGTNRNEAELASTPEMADKIATNAQNDAVLSDMHHSGLAGAKLGGAVAGSISAIHNISELVNGECSVGEAVGRITADTAIGAVTGYATTAISKGIAHKAATFGLTEAGAKALAKSNGHIALATGVVQCGKSLVSYMKGDIDSEQLYSEISHTAITGGAAFYYGALGQIAIPIPVVGALVGSTVGYFIGNMLHQSGLVSLGECEAVRVARERREEVEKLCLTAIPLMRAHRLELENFLQEYVGERLAIFTTAFDTMEHTMHSATPDEFNQGLTAVAQAYACSLPFKNFAEFDLMMRNKTSVLEF